MESRVTKLVEDVVVVWRRRGGGRATPSFPLLISAVCGCRRGGREGGREGEEGYFRSPPPPPFLRSFVTEASLCFWAGDWMA